MLSPSAIIFHSRWSVTVLKQRIFYCSPSYFFAGCLCTTSNSLSQLIHWAIITLVYLRSRVSRSDTSRNRCFHFCRFRNPRNSVYCVISLPSWCFQKKWAPYGELKDCLLLASGRRNNWWNYASFACSEYRLDTCQAFECKDCLDETGLNGRTVTQTEFTITTYNNI
jgi:hypothetical protein